MSSRILLEWRNDCEGECEAVMRAPEVFCQKQIKRSLYVFIATLLAVTTMPATIVASPVPTQTLDVSTHSSSSSPGVYADTRAFSP